MSLAPEHRKEFTEEMKVTLDQALPTQVMSEQYNDNDKGLLSNASTQCDSPFANKLNY